MRDAVSITVTSLSPGPSAAQGQAGVLRKRWRRKVITYLPETQVTSVDEQDGRKLGGTQGDERY